MTNVAFSPDMLKLARGEGNEAVVCCAVSFLELRRLVGHRDRVRTVAWSSDGKVLASGGDDRKIILWDPKKGERLTELKGHRLAEPFFFCLPGQGGRGVVAPAVYMYLTPSTPWQQGQHGLHLRI